MSNPVIWGMVLLENEFFRHPNCHNLDEKSIKRSKMNQKCKIELQIMQMTGGNRYGSI